MALLMMLLALVVAITALIALRMVVDMSVENVTSRSVVVDQTAQHYRSAPKK